jgi:hypothetical protein
MHADNRAALAAATRDRSAAARTRAREAIRHLDRQGLAITFATVATTAGVSRSLLYRDPILRTEIERLRFSPAHDRPRPPAAERSSHASLKARLAAALQNNLDLRADNAQLRAQVAALLGEQRTSTPGKPTSRSIGPCS